MAMIFDDFLAAADSAVALLASDEVAAGWGRASACEGFTVGGLAAHLGWQVQSARWALECPRPAADAPVTGLLGHYAAVPWLGAGVDAPVNVGIRDSGEQRSQAGPAEVARVTREARDEVVGLLAAAAPGEAVAMPWIEGRAMTAEDLLATRLMELLVHGDDLAVSVGVATAAVTDSAYERVNDLLVRLAARRHGPVALLRALARAERAPETVSAF
ncbi:maleylpyruvate isomerase N-terminal domain-containing protein [Kitasatospora sp. NBC_01266]|uniref:maleylpyruvate isomerase N-terminal domain-containing protein n=1 Tax=Kitasatospora sp. NBC_01266 TaxID=2903572 RepID=UPI002E3336B5|nr:maleylpyruvate isomerase N-terminal domain-containing protein [Kitasatospora sp. NBC_01266]